MSTLSLVAYLSSDGRGGVPQVVIRTFEMHFVLKSQRGRGEGRISQLFSGRVWKNEMNSILVSDKSKFWPLRDFFQSETLNIPTVYYTGHVYQTDRPYFARNVEKPTEYPRRFCWSTDRTE